MIDRMVIKPRPPIWIRQIITICPKIVQFVKVSNGTSPVMQVAEVAVNRASIYEAPPVFELIGKLNKTEPISISKANPQATILGYVIEDLVLSLFFIKTAFLCTFISSQ